MEQQLISVGKITNFHGINGEVKVGYSKGNEHHFKEVKEFFVNKNDEKMTLNAENIRFHKEFALIKFKEINSINEAMEFKGLNIYVEIENLRKNLEQDEFLVDDLVGLKACNVFGVELGIVTHINKQGTSDLLGIKTKEGKSFLVPFVKELVPEIDLEKKIVYINAIEGLID